MLIGSVTATAADGHSFTKPYNWYFERATDTTPAGPMREVADFFDKYDAHCVGDTTQKELYLTFDAGFDNGNAAVILDTLKSRGVTAAFFVDGNFVKRNPELVERIMDEGHLLCNHSLEHPDTTKYGSLEEYRKQLEGWTELVKSQTGREPSRFYRPPEGRFSEQTLSFDQQLGYHTVFWTFAYQDWLQDAQPDPDAALEKILSRVSNGVILLLHSVSSTNAQILGELIDRLEADGYTFRSLDELPGLAT